MNPDLHSLQPYPFEKLVKLKQDCVPPPHQSAINLFLGEPQHATPDLVVNAMSTALAHGLGKYPITKGGDALRHSIANWLSFRFKLPADSLDPNRHILPVNGTREALFAFAQCVIDRGASKPLVLMPNPFYQIYEGAALLAGAQPWFVNCLEQTDFQPDFAKVPEEVWARCQLLYICSPNNPCGTVLDIPTLQSLIERADEYDFIIAADECYSEIYADETQPPVGLLQACAAAGRLDFKRCVVFNSLSKRSNAPGLRSGFVAGDADIMRQFLQYRTYHGCAMSLAAQAASIAAWEDETHVQANRELYRQKYDAVMEIIAPVMSVTRPPAGFYLWPQTPMADDKFARELFVQQNVTVLPGRFLSRTAHGVNPGQNRLRIALVAPLDECVEAAQRMRTFQ
ncbi:MAG: succinyldiaminopimelate transaminase [Candidatus Parabeggiatoa sp. nov. 2]|nr:MAG: succinyldiaminopimelate transaminase [Beggiatoa sp. 4572_84]RKZ62428.1 MAG: succinyldiaminopimelate transaminase [Gammaproteobacteria bacterium]HEC84334.1 succinyldiaminopimelate transaminase [Thioploca sp.]